MPSEFYLTDTVKKSGGVACIYLPSGWELPVGQKMFLTIWEDGTDREQAQIFSVTVRSANATGAVKITIPKACGFAIGSWVHTKLLVMEDEHARGNDQA